MGRDRCLYCHGENGEHACNCWAPSPLAGADIVDRLRRYCVEPLGGEAANEIERLRRHPYGHMINERDKEIEQLRGSRDEWEACAKDYLKENEQLRDALGAVYEYIDYATGALPVIRATLGVGKRNA